MDIDSLLDDALDYECDESDYFKNPEDLPIEGELRPDRHFSHMNYKCDESDYFKSPEDLPIEGELRPDRHFSHMNNEPALKNFSRVKIEPTLKKCSRVKIEPTLKKFSRVKIEPTLKNFSHVKIEPTVKNISPRVVLKRIPPQNLPPKPTIKLKTISSEILDQKPDIRLNPIHLQGARVVLKRLTDEDLQSRAKLISCIKMEMNERISKKLRSQGKARTVDYIHLYCCLCKSLQAKRKGLTRVQHCEICGDQLIYLCMKCNRKHYAGYYTLLRHLKDCRESGESKPLNMDSVVLHRCTVCPFTTTFSQRLASHIKKKGHTTHSKIDLRNTNSSIVDCKREKKDIKLEQKEAKQEDSLKIPRSKYANFIVKQDRNDVADRTERFCIACEKICISKMQESTESCRTCNTPLHLRCKKCHWESDFHRSMLAHLRKKCYPCSYRCANCNYTNSTWSLMQQHVMVEHDNQKSSKPESSLRNHREIFYCSLCSFHTNWKSSVGRHRKNIHKA